MPLVAKITRDGENLSLRWGFWHLESMTIAVRNELGLKEGDPDYPLLNLWSRKDTQSGFTLTQGHQFVDLTDDEVLTLMVGDTLHVWRE